MGGCVLVTVTENQIKAMSADARSKIKKTAADRALAVRNKEQMVAAQKDAKNLVKNNRIAMLKAQSESKKLVDRAKKEAQESRLADDSLIQLTGLPEYTTEHKFHQTRRWRLDYVWLDSKVALEVHGGVFSDGRHTNGKGFTSDREKMNEAALMGWIVIEATTEQVRNGMARKWIERALAMRCAL